MMHLNELLLALDADGLSGLITFLETEAAPLEMAVADGIDPVMEPEWRGRLASLRRAHQAAMAHLAERETACMERLADRHVERERVEGAR